MAEVRDPGPEAVDAILREMEEMVLKPTDVARQSRRLRAHIAGLRAKATDLEAQVRGLRGSVAWRDVQLQRR